MALTDLEFYAVVPKEATNLIANPSFEINATGYTLSQSNFTRATTQQRRGVTSLRVAPNANQIAGVYYSVSLTAGTQYSFSADVLDVAGLSYSLWFADNAGTLVGTATTWTGNGHWKRRAVTYTAAATATHRLYITRASTANTTQFYTDGWQLEVGAASTYLDGDMKGFVRTQTDYYWTGTPHASTSYRSGQTKSGGVEVRLKDYMTIISVLGLGLAPIINNSLPNVRGGAFFQSSAFDSRTISLSGKVTGFTHGAIEDSRKALIAAINPRNVSADQPMILRIRGLDGAGGIEQGEPVEAIVQYSGGLEGNWSKPGIDDVPLQFQMFLPYLLSEGDRGKSITINQAIANSDYLLKRSNAGEWSSVSTDFNALISALVRGNDGSVYAGGNFTNVGDANGDYIVKVSYAGVLSSLGTGMNGNVYALAVAPNGDIYAGGAFTSAGGVANTARIAKWTGATWAAVGGGIASGAVYTLCFDSFGNLYIGGTFTNHGDANGDYITKWDGAAYSSLTTGTNGTVYAIAARDSGVIYAAGSFALAGGVANTVKIAKWSGAAWGPLSTGLNGDAYAAKISPNGKLYVGGAFTTAGGVTVTQIAVWNGSIWAALGTWGAGSEVDAIAIDANGNVIAVGQSLNIYNSSTVYVCAFWNGSSWTPYDVIPPVAIAGTAVLITESAAYLAFTSTGSATAPVITSATNRGSAPAAPVIKFTGPGTVYQVKNTTTGKAIYFNLTLLTGETAVLDLNPDNPSFTSTFRGNLINTILAGSNLDLTLLPGDNNMSIFIAGVTTAATAATMTYREQYVSLDGTRY